MPPKKVVKTLDKTVQEKVRRRRTRKEKCLPLSETGENMKIQDIDVSFVSDQLKDQQKDRMVSLKKNDINIILANEVVGRQFKKQTKLKDPTETIVINILKQPKDKLNMKKKTVLKRKIPLKNNKVKKKESVNCEEEPVRKIGRRRIPPKRLEDILEIKEECDSPKDIHETGPVLCQNETKKPIKLRRNKTVPKLDLVENDVTKSEENLDATKSKTPRRKVSLNRNIARSRPRTRKKAEDDTKVSQTEAATTENVTSQTETVENVKKQDIVDVRRNSLASLSELSWTKDISSSSTTTCVTVCSNDFFRIDKRIPIIKLTNVDHKLIGEENNNVSNVVATETLAEQYEGVSKETATAHCTESKDSHLIDEVDCLCPKSPNLSSSSSDSCSDRAKSGQNVTPAINKLSSTLEKLSSKLKNFDLEIINWIGYTDDKINTNMKKIQDKIYNDNFLKEEMNVIIHCKNIKRILSENDPATEPPESKKTNSNVIETDRRNETHKNATLPEPHNPVEDKFNSPKEPLKIISNVIVQRKTCKEMDTVENKSEDDCNYTSLDEDDEDDALSLFAESITGIEPSTRNSTASCGTVCPKEIEEYVPEPLVKNKITSFKSTAYHPTRITIDAQLKDPEDESVLVCEKQSADSTSIHKEQENKNLVETGNSVKMQSKGVEEISRKQNGVTKLIPQNQLLMSSMYKPVSGVKSIVFKGVCFYNLISKCKKNGCNFPHMPVGIDSVKMKLKAYSDAILIQEYMLMRNWPSLRQKYGMCFVEEFVKRNLTKIVVEVALDFIIKDNNNALIVDIVEYVLLYLNMVDLCSIEDLLTFNIKASTTLLCDIFISTIAQSQNFSRFKSVFINLTDLMYRIGRSFSEDVAGHLLERLVILPYDEGLARALIKIIKNTNISIYSNSMVGHLEQQLLSSNISLYEEFISLKNKALSQSTLDSCYTDGERSKQLDKDVRCSPDTTNLDNMNKSSVETKFTRTIDLNKINFLNTNSHVTEIKNDKRYNHSNQFMSWRDRNSYGNTRTVPRNTTMRPPLRPPFKRRSDQKFDGSPSKYQRRNGSNFFKEFS